MDVPFDMRLIISPSSPSNLRSMLPSITKQGVTMETK